MTDITQLAKQAGFYADGLAIKVFPHQYYSVSNADITKSLEEFAQLLRDKFIAELGEPVYQVWNIECGFWEDCHKNHYDMSDDKRALYALKDERK